MNDVTLESLFNPGKRKKNRMAGFFKAGPSYSHEYNDENERGKALLLNKFIGQPGEVVDLNITITAIFPFMPPDAMSMSKSALLQYSKNSTFQANVDGEYAQVRFTGGTSTYRIGQKYRIRGVVLKHVETRDDKQVLKALNQTRTRSERVGSLRTFIPYTALHRVSNITDCAWLLDAIASIGKD